MTIAVVTGTSSGFGHAVSLQLARNGFEVDAGMRNIEKGTDLAVTARKQGLPIKLLEMDIGNAESVTEAFAAITTTGAVDVLVNNAGISGSSPLEFTPEEDAYDNEFERLFGIRPS